jgi:choline dehydrogenase
MSFDWLHQGAVEWPGMGEVLLARSDESRSGHDLHVMLRAPIAIQDVKTIGLLAVYRLEQRNRGRVTLAGTDPLALPVIEPRMLEHEDDRAAIVAGMRIAQRLAETEPLRPYYGKLLSPTPDEDWGDYARRTYDSYHHGVGTCRMGRGTDPNAVVDERLRVRGVRNLWVVDASVMPTVVHGNTNLTTIMIAERGAAFLREAR